MPDSPSQALRAASAVPNASGVASTTAAQPQPQRLKTIPDGRLRIRIVSKGGDCCEGTQALQRDKAGGGRLMPGLAIGDVRDFAPPRGPSQRLLARHRHPYQYRASARTARDRMPGMFAALLAGLAAGLIHVLSGPDHLAAVAPLAGGRGRSWRAGFLWGLGHSGGVLAVGLLALGLRGALP